MHHNCAKKAFFLWSVNKAQIKKKKKKVFESDGEYICLIYVLFLFLKKSITDEKN